MASVCLDAWTQLWSQAGTTLNLQKWNFQSISAIFCMDGWFWRKWFNTSDPLHPLKLFRRQKIIVANTKTNFKKLVNSLHGPGTAIQWLKQLQPIAAGGGDRVKSGATLTALKRPLCTMRGCALSVCILCSPVCYF